MKKTIPWIDPYSKEKLDENQYLMDFQLITNDSLKT